MNPIISLFIILSIIITAAVITTYLSVKRYRGKTNTDAMQKSISNSDIPEETALKNFKAIDINTNLITNS